MVFFDVGQGDAALFVTPEGRTVLIDAGPAGSRIVEFLRARHVDTLDLVIATHNHADHIGGMVAVLQAFPVRNYMDNGLPHTTATYSRTLQLVEQGSARYLKGDARTITLGSAKFHILPRPVEPLNQNDQSLGVLVEFGSFRALLTGDAEIAERTYWLAQGILQDVLLLKVGHHGGENGLDERFLTATRPEIAVISVGRGNGYGHPSQGVLTHLARFGAAVYRTDVLGSIELVALRDGSARLLVEPIAAGSLLDSLQTVPAPSLLRQPGGCCKVCSAGKACGNACISRQKTCRRPPGCACVYESP